MNTGTMSKAGEKGSRIFNLQHARATFDRLCRRRSASLRSGGTARLGPAAVLLGGIFRVGLTLVLLAGMFAAAFPTGQPDASQAPGAPCRVPPAVEAVFHRRVQDLERALLRRDFGAVESWLAPDCIVAGFAGEAGRQVFREALAQLRQAESLRLKSVLTGVPPYRVAVELRSHGLASEREVAFNAILRFVEIRLFQAEVRTGPDGDRTLVSWEPAAGPLPDAIADRFDPAGRLVALDGITVNGVTGCMILDTGTTTLLLNRARFSEWICRPPDAGVLAGAGGVTRRVARVWVRDFDWKGYRLASFETIAADLTPLEARVGRPVLGLLGARLLRPFDLTIDYGRREVALRRLDADGNPLQAYDKSAAGRTLPFELAGPLPVLPVKVGGVCLRLGLDSGATATVIDELAAVRLGPGCRRDLPACRVRGVDQGRRTARRIRLDGARLGPNALPVLNAVVTDLSAQRQSLGLAIDGLLGYEFLHRQPVTINYIKQELRIPAPARSGRP